MDAKLRTWLSGLPAEFALRSSQSPIELRQRILISVSYHQSMSVLHASIVPLFSLSPVIGECGYPQIVSAQIALHHARQISNIFREFWNPGIKYSAFLGYAAYSSSAIQLPLLWCQKPMARDNALANIKTNSQVMESIGKQWNIVTGLVCSKFLRNMTIVCF